MRLDMGLDLVGAEPFLLTLAFRPVHARRHAEGYGLPSTWPSQHRPIVHSCGAEMCSMQAAEGCHPQAPRRLLWPRQPQQARQLWQSDHARDQLTCCWV